MANACGIKIAVNGSETDVDVVNDSASWTAKAGNVRISGGGGSWIREGQPFTAQVDFAVPIHLANLVRTVTIAVTLEASTASSLPTGTIVATPPYRVVFHGDAIAIKGNPSNDIVQIDFASEMSGLLGRRARTAAAPNTGIRTLLSAIESAHSLSMNGSDTVPSDAHYYQCDAPAQQDSSNGEHIRTMLAGSGINMSEEWELQITSPTLRWRPDWYHPAGSVITTRQWTWEAGYPWLFAYPDVGIQYRDFLARINVEGTGSGGTRRWAWAQLDLAAQRLRVGHRDTTLSTWIDNTTDLEKAARELIGKQGEPDYVKMNQITLNIDAWYRAFDTQGAADPEIETWKAAACMLGDVITTRDPFDNTHTDYGNWPAHAPYNGDLYDRLFGLWNTSITDNAVTAAVAEWVIRTITREWSAGGGWQVTYGLEPANYIDYTDIADYSSGTY